MMRPYTWAAVYTDGSILYQIDPVTGQETNSGLIERERLYKILFYGPQGEVCTTFCLDPGSVFFYRRRVELTSRISDAEHIATGVVHILGCWRKLGTEGQPWLQHAVMIAETTGTPMVTVYGQPRTEDQCDAVCPTHIEMDVFTRAAPLT